jgi:hypothetical protein
LFYPSTDICPLIIPNASGYFFTLDSKPRVKTQGYNIAAPPTLGYFFMMTGPNLPSREGKRM